MVPNDVIGLIVKFYAKLSSIGVNIFLIDHFPRGGDFLTLCVRRARKVDNAELPRPTAGEKTRQKNINPFPRAYLGNHAS